LIEYNHLSKFVPELEICGKCGDCASAVEISTAKKHINKPCVVKNVLGFEAYDARGRILILKRLLDKTLTFDQNLLDWTYTCLLCGNCQETCLAIENGINLPAMMEALRQDLVDSKLYLPKHLEIIEKTQKFNNPYGEPHDLRFKFILSENFPLKADVLVFFGCTAAYRQQSIALATYQLLKKANVNFTILKDEKCCGSILFRYGQSKSLKERARELIDQIQASGAKIVIFPCAGCYRTFKIDYPQIIEMPENIKFVHVTEFIESLMKDKKLFFKSQLPTQISYHDPCHLGRAAGVYEAPRVLLNAIVSASFIELETRRNFSHCCGAGGGVKSCFPELSAKIATNRIIEAAKNGINYLTSACPFCKTNLTQNLNGQPFEVLDITELLLKFLDESLSGAVIPSEVPIETHPLTQEYINYLSKTPEIFVDLVSGSVLDFVVYDTIDNFEDERPPLGKFHVVRLENKIEIHNGKADNADLQLALSEGAVQELIQSKTKKEYSHKFGQFYNDPEEDHWIDFVLHKRTKTLIKMGYGKFAEEAGILEEDDDFDNLDNRVKIKE